MVVEQELLDSDYKISITPTSDCRTISITLVIVEQVLSFSDLWNKNDLRVIAEQQLCGATIIYR
jgi:hypothetical protein